MLTVVMLQQPEFRICRKMHHLRLLQGHVVVDRGPFPAEAFHALLQGDVVLRLGGVREIEVSRLGRKGHVFAPPLRLHVCYLWKRIEKGTSEKVDI